MEKTHSLFYIIMEKIHSLFSFIMEKVLLLNKMIQHDSYQPRIKRQVTLLVKQG